MKTEYHTETKIPLTEEALEIIRQSLEVSTLSAYWCVAISSLLAEITRLRLRVANRDAHKPSESDYLSFTDRFGER